MTRTLKQIALGQFGVRQLLVFVVVVAGGCAAWRKYPEIVSAALVMLTIVTLLSAGARAFFATGRARRATGGMALCGWAYLLLVNGFDISTLARSGSPSNWAIQRLQEWAAPQPPQDDSAWMPSLNYSPPAASLPSGTPTVYYPVATVSPNSPLAPAVVFPTAQQDLDLHLACGTSSGASWAAGQCLYALAVGLIGACVAARLGKADEQHRPDEHAP